MQTLAPTPNSALKHSTADAAPWPLPRLLAAALWLVSGGIVAGWLALAAMHISDDYRMTHTHGVWIAAAESAREGRLYPPLFDGEHYAGTRYMPVPILLNAAASAVFGDPVTGGKALAATLMAALLTLVAILLRRVRCPWPLAMALAASIVATDSGLDAGTTIGGDLVPAALQLAALAVALGGDDQRRLAGAGVLAGFAAASKLTGIWAFFAIATALVVRGDRRRAATFIATAGATGAVLLGTVQLVSGVSGGGLLEHLEAFSAAGVQGADLLLRAPAKLLFQITEHALSTIILLPLAVVGGLAVRWQRHSVPVVHLAFVYAVLLLFVVYSDVGTGSNQLLDVVLLTALAVGVFAGDAVSREPAVQRLVMTAAAVTVIWGAGTDLVRTVAHDLRLSAAAYRAGQSAPPVGKVVAAMVRPDEQVLAADPSIDIALGRRPLVMDPFMLVRLDRTRPDLVDPLIARIERRDFDVVVMVVRLENPETEFWWTDYHFGPRVARALRECYQSAGRAGRYHLYRPKQ